MVPKSAKSEGKGSQREGRAKSFFYLASTLKKVTCNIKNLGAKINQRKAKEMPKGAKKRQKGGQRQPKGGKREARGSPGGSKTYPKTIKKIEVVFGMRFWKPPAKSGQSGLTVGTPFLLHFEAKFVFCDICWLRVFIDFRKFLDAFGEVFSMTLEGHFEYLFRLCEKRRTPRNHRPCQCNRGSGA